MKGWGLGGGALTFKGMYNQEAVNATLLLLVHFTASWYNNVLA